MRFAIFLVFICFLCLFIADKKNYLHVAYTCEDNKLQFELFILVEQLK